MTSRGDELRQVGLGAQEARLAAIRAAAEAAAAWERETIFAAVMADWADWYLATRQQRQLAVAADAELRHRHPDQKFPALRSAEPPPATQAQHDELILKAGEQIREISPWISELAARRREFQIRLSERRSLLLTTEDPDCADFAPAFDETTQRRVRHLLVCV